MNTKQSITLLTSPIIAKSVIPLLKLGVKNFNHDLTFEKGEVAMLANNGSIFELYHNKRWPLSCTDETGRVLAEGVYLGDTLESKYNDCSIIFPKLRKELKYSCSIHILEKEADCHHFYTLTFEHEVNDFTHWSLNHITMIRNHLESYKLDQKAIIEEAKAKKNRITLPIANNYLRSKDSYNPLDCTFSLKLIHKDDSKIIYLPKQAARCLRKLFEGKPIKAIALEMNLSPRTIEYYLNRLKRILGCSNTRELLIYYSHQALVAPKSLKSIKAALA